jgi:uncharacterized protein YdaU (DUF1376 family)
MNYYERHLGDYARDAGYLSMLEHGAYNLIMDRYYVTEVGIPDEEKYRIARAQTKDEKKAVDSVLKDFFTLNDGVWTKGRIEEEITKAQTKIKAAQVNGKKGGRPKGNPQQTQEEPSGLSVGLETETQVKAHQTPDTRHQNELTNSSETGKIVEPTLAATVCKSLKDLGYIDINPSHPKLQAMLEAGATLDEFVNAAKIAKPGNKKFTYLIGTVEGMRKQAALENVTQGNFAEAAAAKAWRKTDDGIVAKAKELKIGTAGLNKFQLIEKIEAKLEQNERQEKAA